MGEESRRKVLGAGQAEEEPVRMLMHPGAELEGLRMSLLESESHAIGSDGPLLFSKDLDRMMVKNFT